MDGGSDPSGSMTAEQACLTAAKEEATRYLVSSSPMLASLQADGKLAKLSGFVDRSLNEYCRTSEQVTFGSRAGRQGKAAEQERRQCARPGRSTGCQRLGA